MFKSSYVCACLCVCVSLGFWHQDNRKEAVVKVPVSHCSVTECSLWRWRRIWHMTTSQHAVHTHSLRTSQCTNIHSADNHTRKPLTRKPRYTPGPTQHTHTHTHYNSQFFAEKACDCSMWRQAQLQSNCVSVSLSLCWKTVLNVCHAWPVRTFCVCVVCPACLTVSVCLFVCTHQLSV